MKIIGIAGKAGSGKDTVGQLLRSILEENKDPFGFPINRCTKLSFANKLKEVCCCLFGWERHRLDYDHEYKESNTLDNGFPDPACERLGMTRRQIIQTLGTEGLRDGLNKDIWIICLELDILRGTFAEYNIGFLTDCRFKNELEFVRRQGGILIRVDSDNTLTEHTSHSSETDWLDWDDWDFVVRNDLDPLVSKDINLAILRDKLIPIIAEIKRTP